MFVRLLFFVVLFCPVMAFAAEGSTPLEDETLWLLMIIEKGGPIMYPLILCSFLGLGLAFERLFALRQNKVISPEHFEEIKRYWMRNEIDRAIERCNEIDIPLYRILKAGLLHCRHGIYEIERAIEAAGQHESSLLSTNLRMMGTLANLSPMLGLLGTVMGMIQAFDVIATSGTGNPALVATGISQALITTAAGLIVGIPILLCYHYFKGRVDSFVFQMEEISLSLIEELIHKKNKI